jgi:mannose-1-phosphate guanylyltransferase
MKIVVFAGGTGKRFWPVSRKNSPKQFSPLITGKPLLRLRIELLLKGYKPEDIFISTGKKYEKEVKAIAPELPERNFILEPEMRDTGPAVTLAVAYINKLYPEELISIQWSDHLIKEADVFLESLNRSEIVLRDDSSIGAVLVAVPARFPSPHRGYIHFGNEIEKVSDKITLYDFVEFKEKPTKEVAIEFIKDGKYGWNPGYWCLRAEYYLKKNKEHKPEMFETITKIVANDMKEPTLSEFNNVEKISADYAFAEYIKSNEAKVILTDMGWSDIGEWIALKEALEDSEESNVTKGNVIDLGSRDSIIYNLEDSKTISTIGLDGMVVVNTKDVIAIFHKEDNKRLKEFLDKLEKDGKEYYL